NSIGSEWSEARGINDSRQIVGQCDAGSSKHAFLYDPDTDVTLDLTPGVNGNSIANAINNAGQIAGSITSGGNVRGFIYQNGGRTNLPLFAGGTSCDAVAINHGGVAAGTA